MQNVQQLFVFLFACCRTSNVDCSAISSLVFSILFNRGEKCARKPNFPLLKSCIQQRNVAACRILHKVQGFLLKYGMISALTRADQRAHMRVAYYE